MIVFLRGCVFSIFVFVFLRVCVFVFLCVSVCVFACILPWSGAGGQLLTSSCCGQGLAVSY